MTPSRDIGRLIEIMRALRTPDSGCPWDLKQTSRSLAPFAVEEAYEVIDAIVRDDRADLCDELGDLLLQVVFHAQIAAEDGSFDFGDVVEAITRKMIRRHPHVFGDANGLTASDVDRLWASIKAEEKRERASRQAPRAASALDEASQSLAPVRRALALQHEAAKVGFDWADTGDVFEKIDEELRELTEAVSSGDEGAMVDEFGDVLFALLNLARHLHLDAEVALAGTNLKFDRRFRIMEQILHGQGITPAAGLLEIMDRAWTEAKRRERLAPNQPDGVVVDAAGSRARTTGS